MSSLLNVADLCVRFPSDEGYVEAVKNVSFNIQAGEIFALVGESGSGKSTICKAIMGLHDSRIQLSGQIELDGLKLLDLPEHEWPSIRGKKGGIILQDAQNALHPFKTLRQQIGESLQLDEPRLRGSHLRDLCKNLLRDAGFPEPDIVIDRYPHELSGGQAQRAVIAIVRARKPKLIIADEPTTAVDVTTQAQFIGYMRQMAENTGAAILVVTHDFGLVSEISDRVGVMRHGQLLEIAPREAIISKPSNAYTKLLLQAAKSVLLPEAKNTTPTHMKKSGGANVSVKNLSRIYGSRGTFFSKNAQSVRAVDNISLDLPAGSITGIGGESGCGKSTLSRLISGLDIPQTGQVHIGSSVVGNMTFSERARTVQYVFQNPFASLNPRLRIFSQVRETLDCLSIGTSSERDTKVHELLEKMGLPVDLHYRFPHELSGGQLQRAAIAAAMIVEPKVLVCDEPVSALDVSVRSTVLHSIMELRETLGTTIVVVGHDLNLFSAMCDNLLIMFAGRVVEAGPVNHILSAPQHPYSKHLIDAAPQIDLERPKRSSQLRPPETLWYTQPAVLHDLAMPKEAVA